MEENCPCSYADAGIVIIGFALLKPRRWVPLTQVSSQGREHALGNNLYIFMRLNHISIQSVAVSQTLVIGVLELGLVREERWWLDNEVWVRGVNVAS